MRIYQLKAIGCLTLTEEQRAIVSKKVYRSREAAEDAIPDFIKLVTTPSNKYDIGVLMKKKLQIKINDLELINKEVK